MSDKHQDTDQPEGDGPDERLGAALRELPVPEHRDAFWGDLGKRLGAEMRPRRGAGDGAGRDGRARVHWSSVLVAVLAIAAIVALVLFVVTGGR